MPVPPRPFLSDIARRFGDFGFGPPPKALTAVLAKLPPVLEGSTRIYRTQPHVPLTLPQEAAIFGVNVHPELERVKGQWFTSRPDNISFYMAARGDPELVYLDVPKAMLEDMRADLNPAVRDFSRSVGEYIVPRELLPLANQVPIRPAPMPGQPGRRPFLEP